MSSQATAQAAAPATCSPSWGNAGEIAKFMPDHPYMLRGYSADLAAVIKALEAALTASGYPIASSRRGSIESKASSAVELKGADRPHDEKLYMGQLVKYYKVEQMTAYAKTADGQQYVFLTYQVGKSKSNSRFEGTGAMDDPPLGTPGIVCDAAPYKDILDQVGKAVTPP